MKAERFIREYAAAKLRDISNNELMPEDERRKNAEQITKAVTMRNNGIITVDETISIILKA